jgi:hypothetical protein
MRISKITLLFLVFIIVLSVFVAKISNLITVNYDYTNNEDIVVSRSFDADLVLDDGNEHLMWFVQVSFGILFYFIIFIKVSAFI